MYRSAMLTLIVFALSNTLVAVEVLKGQITKIDEGSVTVKDALNKEGKAYDIAKDCKFFRQVKDAKVEIKEGAKAAVFKNIPERGLEATVSTYLLI
jgi:hypothetical protein